MKKEILTKTFTFMRFPKPIKKPSKCNICLGIEMHGTVPFKHRHVYLGKPKERAKKRIVARSKAGKKKSKPSLGKIKQIPLKTLKKKADTLFSLEIRKDYNNKCVTPDALCKGFMQASHLFKRSYYDIRWDKKNVFCACSHHNYNHDQGFRPSPHILTNYFLKRFGAEEYNKLFERTKIIYTGRMVREKALEVIKKYSKEVKI